MESPKNLEPLTATTDVEVDIDTANVAQAAVQNTVVVHDKDYNWRQDGKCREVAPDTFFPSNGAGVIRAQRICATCSVSEQCLEYALDNHIDHGVWGGKSENERDRILIARRRSQ